MPPIESIELEQLSPKIQARVEGLKSAYYFQDPHVGKGGLLFYINDLEIAAATFIQSELALAKETITLKNLIETNPNMPFEELLPSIIAFATMVEATLQEHHSRQYQ